MLSLLSICLDESPKRVYPDILWSVPRSFRLHDWALDEYLCEHKCPVFKPLINYSAQNEYLMLKMGCFTEYEY